jgi:PAT family beta-lactamase induction signal transducer AmpG
MNQFTSYFNRFSIIFLLGFLSGLPHSLFATSLQAWFTQAGYSVSFVSNLGLLYFVFLLRILMGPLMDRFYSPSLGRRKTWLLISQIGLFISIEILAFCDPKNHLYTMIAFSVILTLLTAIADIVIDAHRIEYLEKEQFGLGAVIAVYGYRIALLVSGGGLLVVAHYHGFKLAYSLVGICFLIGSFIVYFSHEPKGFEPPQNSQGFLTPYLEILQSPWCYSMIGLIFCIKFGEVFVSNSSILIIPFMMKGLGLSLPQIAFLNKVLGLGAQLLGGALSAFFIFRYSLMRLLLCFGSLLALSNLGFAYLSLHPQSQWLMYSAIFFENLASGLCTTVMVAILMRIVNPAYTASQFSFWVIMGVIPRLVAAPLVGLLFPRLGWSGLFLMSTIICFGFILFWLNLKSQNKHHAQILECFA